MNQKMIFFISLLISIALFGGFYYLLFKIKADLKTVEIQLGNHTLQVEVADTFRARAQGLSGHKPLTDAEGMLFIFPFPAKYGFWNKGMTFPLDIVWLKDKKVVGVSENLPPANEVIFDLTTFYPPEKVDMALELNSGDIKKLKISLGESLELK